MIENKVADETAENRFKIISPVLVAKEEGTDAAKIIHLKKDVCTRHGISYRTLGRWLDAHEKNGFSGLRPMPKVYRGHNIIPEGLIEEAILLRREVPSRSVSQIIEILELEGKAPVGLLRRTTLQEKMAARGYSSRLMKLYQQKGVASRRFERLDRNDLWQADIKFVSYLNVQGKKKEIYLVCFIDDKTRYVVHAEFYDNLEQTIVQDCFRKAIIKEGLPSRVYFDNGKQFRNRWMQRACAKLNIKLLFAKPYSPESTGKSERWNRTVDSFLAEAKLKKLSTLDSYNYYLKVWLQESYQSKVHASLKDTPENAYKTSKKPLRFVEQEVIADAFLQCDTRKVDKSGCVRFDNKLYDVGIPLMGQTVDVVFDPADLRTITIEHKPTGYTKRVNELVIGPYAGKRPKLPDTLLPEPCETSRLLDLKEQQYTKNQSAVRRAIRYSDIEIGGESNV
ncbi:MAG: DDE-type integrase/transposase/recombinase [Oscillospiraceae bacterium]|nr:DDE-type integrase/transposase/recombinase [Oscillospiraceae bacterium]